MVRGLDVWKDYFADYTDSYVLIGGAACNIYEEEFAMNPRATKDLDLILVVEALSPEFGSRFWDFIREGNYTSRQIGNHGHEYYRFINPENRAYPQQIELFARRTGLLTLPADANIEPIHIDDELSSLSAILMDDDYYQFTLSNSQVVDGVHLANVETLICLKAKAYLDLDTRKQAGEAVDNRNIEKHKKDIMYLAAMIPGDASYQLPDSIKEDIKAFYASVKDFLPNADFMKSANLARVKPEDLLEVVMNSMA